MIIVPSKIETEPDSEAVLTDVIVNGLLLSEMSLLSTSSEELPLSSVTVNVSATAVIVFRAKGSDVEVPWIGGGSKTVVGSSYAAPHVSGLVARILSKAPNLSPLLMKDLLHRIAKPEKDLPW